MSEIALDIGGRVFKVSCAPGEEAHVTGLGNMIDEKVRGLGVTGQSEGQMLLFAALVLADELHETRTRGSASVAPAAAPAEDPALAQRLESIAESLEKCALHLEG